MGGVCGRGQRLRPRPGGLLVPILPRLVLAAPRAGEGCRRSGLQRQLVQPMPMMIFGHAPISQCFSLVLLGDEFLVILLATRSGCSISSCNADARPVAVAGRRTLALTVRPAPIVDLRS